MIYEPYPFKRCTKCDCEYPRTRAYFSFDRRTYDRLYSHCRTCHNAYVNRWMANNPEKRQSKDKRWVKNNPDSVRAAQHRWEIKNRSKKRANATRHYAHKQQAEGSHTPDDVAAQYKLQRGCCYYCHKKVGSTYQVDHVVPLSRGGSNGPENLVIACPRCNQRKKDKLPHEWVEGGRLL